MEWKGLLCLWRHVESRVEAALAKFDRQEDARTTQIEIVSTVGWSDEQKRAWFESMRRAHDLRRAKRRRPLPDEPTDDSEPDHDRKG